MILGVGAQFARRAQIDLPASQPASSKLARLLVGSFACSPARPTGPLTAWPKRAARPISCSGGRLFKSPPRDLGHAGQRLSAALPADHLGEARARHELKWLGQSGSRQRTRGGGGGGGGALSAGGAQKWPARGQNPIRAGLASLGSTKRRRSRRRQRENDIDSL